MTAPKPEPASECHECGGSGSIAYHFDMDTTRIVPCHRCFPDSDLAQETERQWQEASRG